MFILTDYGIRIRQQDNSTRYCLHHGNIVPDTLTGSLHIGKLCTPILEYRGEVQFHSKFVDRITLHHELGVVEIFWKVTPKEYLVSFCYETNPMEHNKANWIREGF